MSRWCLLNVVLLVAMQSGGTVGSVTVGGNAGWVGSTVEGSGTVGDNAG